MFCNGECFKGRKQCGLLYEVLLENTKTGQPETVRKCVFHHLLDSFLRQETGQIRLQSAVESGRNEKAKGDQTIVASVLHGFNSLLQVVDGRRDSVQNMKVIEREQGK